MVKSFEEYIDRYGAIHHEGQTLALLEYPRFDTERGAWLATAVSVEGLEQMRRIGARPTHTVCFAVDWVRED